MENKFKTIFGVKSSQVKKTCLITPFIDKQILTGLKIQRTDKGILYTTGENELFTLINAKTGSAFIGDCVLLLDKTPCENIIYFGSCGSVNDGRYKIGDMLKIKRSWAMDSFTDVLLEKEPEKIYSADAEFLGKFNYSEAVCLTISSLEMEERYSSFMKKNAIDVVDMEASAVYSASDYIKRKSAAILYVTDIFKTHPYYFAMARENMQKIKITAENAAKKLYEELLTLQ